MPRLNRLHALTHYEPILRFANTEVTEENYLELTFGFLTRNQKRGIEIGVLDKRRQEAGVLPAVESTELRRLAAKGARFPLPYGVARAIRLGKYRPEPRHDIQAVLKGCYTLAGRGIDTQGATALRSLLIASLEPFIEAYGSELRTGQDQSTNFSIYGQKPLLNPEIVRADDGAFDPVTNDLLDIWYGYLSHLLADLRAGKSRVVQLKGHKTVLRFRPLYRCPACTHYFFRAGGPRQVTCGRRKCVDRHATSRRQRPARARSTSTSPPAS